MITSIIFSKDRALQLDLTLKSIKRNFPQSSEQVVIYDCSDGEYEKSYEILKTEHPNVAFNRQTPANDGGLFLDVFRCIRGAGHAPNIYTCFFTDDCIVYREVTFTQNEITKLFYVPVKDSMGNDVHFSCISLRLGQNTIQRDYGDGVLNPDAVPNVSSVGAFLAWNRTSIPVGGYWSYALSVDGHIFQKECILEFCKELMVLYDTGAFDWQQTPNEFESKLQRFWFDLPTGMACLPESCVVNSPNNRVQEMAPNAYGTEFSYPQESLNKKFTEGCRINLEGIDFQDIVCPHQEIDIMKGLYNELF